MVDLIGHAFCRKVWEPASEQYARGGSGGLLSMALEFTGRDPRLSGYQGSSRGPIGSGESLRGL